MQRGARVVAIDSQPCEAKRAPDTCVVRAATLKWQVPHRARGSTSSAPRGVEVGRRDPALRRAP
eukprot:5140633-Alexandrium_andersonii.AAC.1